jgi:hypothetical protein
LNRFSTAGTIVIYELRTYTCLPGRLPKLLKRFETGTLAIWEKHGIRSVGFWTTLIGTSNNELIYLLAWDSLAERESKWEAFATDPHWLSVRAESEADGPIVANISSQLLKPTEFYSLR